MGGRGGGRGWGRLQRGVPRFCRPRCSTGAAAGGHVVARAALAAAPGARGGGEGGDGGARPAAGCVGPRSGPPPPPRRTQPTSPAHGEPGTGDGRVGYGPARPRRCRRGVGGRGGLRSGPTYPRSAEGGGASPGRRPLSLPRLRGDTHRPRSGAQRPAASAAPPPRLSDPVGWGGLGGPPQCLNTCTGVMCDTKFSRICGPPRRERPLSQPHWHHGGGA